MGTILTELRKRFKQGDIVTHFIYINVGIFIVTSLIEVCLNLFNHTAIHVFSLFALPASIQHLIQQPWTLLTYMFMHSGIWHILFNMMCLYFMGKLSLHFFSSKHLRGIYILGGLFGALFYILAYNFFPYFSSSIESATLVGASASILAIVAALAYAEPNYPVTLFLIKTIRLKYLALIIFGIDLLLITSSNGGGHIAHLGGAVAGIWFAAGLKRGIDFTAFINKPLDVLALLFNKSRWKRKPKMKVRYGQNDREKDYDYNAKKQAQSKEVDSILEKLKKSGYNNLTTEEKKKLFDASQK